MKRLKHICKDFENIENYEKALADNFKGWCIHHRLETHNSNGERRIINISASELIALNMYYNRPASELVFLRRGEHSALHNSGENNSNYGKHLSEETRNKQSKANKGKPRSEEIKNKISKGNKGKPKSEKHKNKLSEVWNYDKHFTEETRNKLSKNGIGRHWYNNGQINKFCYECPDGFMPGQIRKTIS